MWWIRQSILQALAEQSRIVRLPLNKVGSLNKINRAFSELEQQFEREPSPEELAAILEIGFVQELLVYASVRYSIYRSRDFDERVDGVIYAIAAGLGYATVLNFQYVMQNGGVDVGVGAMTVTINALAQASFAGIIGYFLGQAKFETTPRYWLAMGVILAAVLNGVFFFLEDQVTMRGLSFTPLNGVILAGVFAFVILTIVFFLIRRANAETMAIARMRAEPPPQAAG